MSGLKLKYCKLTHVDQINTDLPTVELGIVELRSRTWRVAQSDAQQKYPNARGELQQFGMVQQLSLSYRKSACVRIVIHRANDVVHNYIKSRIAGYVVSGK